MFHYPLQTVGLDVIAGLAALILAAVLFILGFVYRQGGTISSIESDVSNLEEKINTSEQNIKDRLDRVEESLQEDINTIDKQVKEMESTLTQINSEVSEMRGELNVLYEQGGENQNMQYLTDDIIESIDRLHSAFLEGFSVYHTHRYDDRMNEELKDINARLSEIERIERVIELFTHYSHFNYYYSRLLA